jgi:isopentenyl diphosphate isomerase/L-lactate dehydrogenase-like FMN-dependent dehydrogenase
VLHDVSTIDLSTTVLGAKVSLPVLIAPCGGHQKAHPEGEFATYRAATTCGTVFAVSANASADFAELAKAASGRRWLQLYPFRDKEMTKDWLRRAKDAGYEAVCVTLIPNGPASATSATGTAIFAASISRRAEMPPAATWRSPRRGRPGGHLEGLGGSVDCRLTGGRKGHHDREDAGPRASGRDAVIVSNHGGAILIIRWRPSRCCPRSLPRSRGKSKFISTAASSAARTLLKRSP